MYEFVKVDGIFIDIDPLTEEEINKLNPIEVKWYELAMAIEEGKKKKDPTKKGYRLSEVYISEYFHMLIRYYLNIKSDTILLNGKVLAVDHFNMKGLKDKFDYYLNYSWIIFEMGTPIEEGS